MREARWLEALHGPARAFLARYERLWSHPDVSELVDLWHEDAQMQHPDLHASVVEVGAIMDYVANVLAMAPDLRIRPMRAAVNGDLLFVEFEGTGTFAQTAVTWRGVDLYELRGDRAARGVGYFDTHMIRQALAASTATT